MQHNPSSLLSQVSNPLQLLLNRNFGLGYRNSSTLCSSPMHIMLCSRHSFKTKLQGARVEFLANQALCFSAHSGVLAVLLLTANC